MNRFPISIASYSFHGMLEEGRIDIFGYLEMLHSRYRVANADIWSGFLPTLEEGFLKKVREEMGRRDIALANLCVDGPHLWMDDVDERERHHALALRYIQAATLLGARTIRIDAGILEDEMPDEAFEYVVRTYREYAGICHNEGIRIGTENHWGASRIPANLRRIRDAVNHPGYGHLLHFQNFARDMEDGYDAVIPIAMHSHIAAETIPVAKEIIRRLAASGYKGTYSVEHHSAELELERVEWQLGSLRSIMAELEREGLEGPVKPDYFHNIYDSNK